MSSVYFFFNTQNLRHFTEQVDTEAEDQAAASAMCDQRQEMHRRNTGGSPFWHVIRR